MTIKAKRGRPKKNPNQNPTGVAAEKIKGLCTGKKISKMGDVSARKHNKTVDLGLQAKVKLLEYLADPRNPFLSRTDIATKVLGYKTTTGLYYHISSAEIKEIEIEAMEMRRAAYISRLSMVDDALFKKAYEGDVHAIKLIYQRFEGWTEKKEYHLPQGISVNIVRFGDIEINGEQKNNYSSE